MRRCLIKNLIKYTLRNEFTSVSTYLVPLIGVIIYMALTSVQIFGSFAQEDISFIQAGNAFAFITIFSISIIFISLKVVTIFKRPMDNGLDVLYSSKPITTKGRVLAKFISLWILIIYFSVIFFVATLICGSLDKNASSMEIFNYGISILIGNITILFAASAIFVITSLKLTQRSVLMFATSIAVFVPTFSIVVSQTLKAKMPSEESLPGYMKVDSKLQDITKNEAFIDNSNENTIFINNKNMHINKFTEGYKEYKKNKVYQVLAYFDPWYQLSSIYDVTYKSKFAKSSKKWSENTITFKQDEDLFKIHIGNEIYTPIISTRNLSYSNNNKIEALNFLKSGKKRQYYRELEKYKDKFNSWSFAKQMIFVSNVFQWSNKTNFATILSGTQSKKGFVEIVNQLSNDEVQNLYNIGYWNSPSGIYEFNVDAFALLAWQLMINVDEIKSITKFKNPKTLGLSDRYGNTYDVVLAKDGDVINVIIPSDYINKIGVYVFWAFVTFILVISSIFIISRKDSY